MKQTQQPENKSVPEKVKFDNFKKEGNLMLPHSVSVSVSTAEEMPKAPSSLTFQKFEINKKIDANIFQPPTYNKQPENQVKK